MEKPVESEFAVFVYFLLASANIVVLGEGTSTSQTIEYIIFGTSCRQGCHLGKAIRRRFQEMSSKSHSSGNMHMLFNQRRDDV